MNSKISIGCLFIAFILIFSFSCQDQKKEEKPPAAPVSSYLGHADSVGYVGMQTCRKCHENIYQNFIQTGMGQSFDTATMHKSAAEFGKNKVIYDSHRDMYYHSFWKSSEMYIREFRMEGKDTVHLREEKVDYIIGSGQHTNSHIFNTNGYLHQMPMTFYTQSKEWDLPPGFENGFNSRFSRKIGLECMSCHNSHPGFVKGSENKYTAVPDGINCERCHGPGAAHVELKSLGEMVDTSKFIDFSIINPGKLPVDLQFDVCQRCHLQGNAVLKEGRSFFDYKPGQRLSDYMTVFVPKYKGNDDEFIMASHADRLKMSPCFIKSFKPEDTSDPQLRPYKQSMTCVTCHNPHISVKVTGNEVFNNACRNCHTPASKKECTEKLEVRLAKGDNCYSCHMPKSGTIDIPHVTTTDHYIRKPVSKKKKDAVKEFIGLHAVNEKSPDHKTRAKAFINQYEKFEFKTYYLDSASLYLKDETPEQISENLNLLVQLAFMRNDLMKITSYVSLLGREQVIGRTNKISYDNSDAWTLYRISEAFTAMNQQSEALMFIEKACILAPYNLDFQLKMGSLYAAAGQIERAMNVYEFVIRENPKIPAALVNLGYLQLVKGQDQIAESLYWKALSLDPDYEQGLMNLAGLHVYRKEMPQAKEILKKILKKNPANKQAAEILKTI